MQSEISVGVVLITPLLVVLVMLLRLAICFDITVLTLVVVLALRLAICVDTNAPAVVLVKAAVLALLPVLLVYLGGLPLVPHLLIEILPPMSSPMLPPKNQAAWAVLALRQVLVSVRLVRLLTMRG
jgi:hypothetical protein